MTAFETQTHQKPDNLKLKSVSLAKGFGVALYPNNWKEVNKEEADKSKYVYIRYRLNYPVSAEQPVYVYFTQVCYFDYNRRDAECDRMDDMINDLANIKYAGEEYIHLALPIKGSSLPFGEPSDQLGGACIIRPDNYDIQRDDHFADGIVPAV